MSVGGLFASLRASIGREVAHHHPLAQAGRFTAWFAVTLAVQVLAGAPVGGWADLRSVLAATGPVAWRQWRKTLPVAAVHRAVDEHEASTVTPEPPVVPRW